MDKKPQKAKMVHLHCHSEYSSLDGGSKISDMPKRLDDLGMSAMALTDHGVMQGIPDFYHELKASGIQPIIGLEAYLTEDQSDKKGHTWHITLLAENNQGYRNLCKISSHAFINGTIMTIGRPRARADWELLAENSEGIICLTGCMAGPVMNEIMIHGNLSRARANVERMIKIFGKSNVYGEIQNVGIITAIPPDSELAKKLGKKPLTEEEAANYESPHGDVSEEIVAGDVPISQTEANAELVEICKDLGIPYVVTGDVHYLEEDDADPHDGMICIGTGQVKRGKRRFSLLPKRYHMRSDEEMLSSVPDWPEALEETLKVADRCNVEIEWGKELLPRYPLPDEFKSSKDYLSHLCHIGLDERYPENHPKREEALKRLDYELGVIDRMGYNDYFLIVWDFTNEAHRRGIPTGPGRGSAAGAIVAYTLDITKLDPLEYGLLFERFLNPDRVSMPDIDFDSGVTPGRGREELIEYVREKYNSLAGVETAVCQIVTFSKFKAKGALRDSARVLAEPSEEGRSSALKLGDRLAGMIPDDPKATMKSVWDDKQEGKMLRSAYGRGGHEKDAIKLASWLEGLVRAYSTHAAAVIISDHDLTDELPLQKLGDKKDLETQYDMGYAEKLGLLKMDFLGLKNLDIVWDAVYKIKHVRGIEIEPYKDIPLDDPATYKMLANGESIGVFQFESSGMQGALREIKPTVFNDLIAIVSLYRPGPMAHIPTYAARKAGKQTVEYLDPRLEEILSETYGIVCYQEQSMIIARELAGFSPGQADDLRKAIGKKLHDKMAELKDPYIKGCLENGITKEDAETLWADNEAAADYSFNKSHAACYAYLAYITAYLKANYPEEYMAALLSSAMGHKDKPRLYLTEAKRMGIRVLPPEINRSLKDFAVHKSEKDNSLEILFGLNAIKGVGGAVVENILLERKTRGDFKSIHDLIKRMPKLTKSAVQALIKSGALDMFGNSRKALFDSSEEMILEVRKQIKAEEREFVNRIKSELDGEIDIEGLSEEKRDTKKLTPLGRKGIEAAAKAYHKNTDISKEDLADETLEGLKKEVVRAEKAKVRKELKEGKGAGVSGIASEEEDGDEASVIESRAEAVLSSQINEIKKMADQLTPKCIDAIKRVSEDDAEEDGLASALEEEAGRVVSGEEWPEVERLNIERQMLGVYVSGHPLEGDAKKWANYVTRGLGQIDHEHISKKHKIVGAIVDYQPIRTKAGKNMARLTVEDLTGARDLIIFPDTFEGGPNEILELGAVLYFGVSVDEDTFQKNRKEDEEEEEGAKPIRLTVNEFFRWDPDKLEDPDVARAKNKQEPEDGHPVVIEIKQDQFKAEFVRGLQAACKENPGQSPIHINIDGETKKTALRIDGRVNMTPILNDLLEG